jgi:Cdc6-like AAA superfamily ATPase
MELFTPAKVSKDFEKRICYPPRSNSDLMLDVLKTLPFNIKLILYAILMLHDRDKNINVTVADVVLEYQRLADESISSLSTSQVTDKIRDLVMLGFLKCKYVRKGSGRIKYIHIYQPDEIPKYISVLQEELGKVRFEDIVHQTF